MAKSNIVPGQRFGRLTVIERAPSRITAKGNAIGRWRCKCDCGNEITTTTGNLRSGDTKSCGCWKAEWDVLKMTTHGHSKERLHKVWKAMRKRCRNPANADYSHYGGRGIKVCPEWQSYPAFREWALDNGYRDDLTIDRVDVDGDYCPTNCRWVDRKTQGNNRSNNVYYAVDGETLTVAQIAEKYHMKYTTVYNRLRRGLTAQEAIRPIIQTKVS